jgi:hypothetical protein
MPELHFAQTGEGQFLCDATGRVVATITLGGLAGQALGDAIVAACQRASELPTLAVAQARLEQAAEIMAARRAPRDLVRRLGHVRTDLATWVYEQHATPPAAPASAAHAAD